MGRKILVAYDSSDLSREAIEEAKRQSSLSDDAVIHIVTVVTPGISSNNTAASGNLSMDEVELLYPELEEIKKDLDKSGVKAIIKVLTDFSQKNPGIAICEYAKEEEIDQIIVGSRGLSNLKIMLLGSVSNIIVQRASCHVLVIK